MIIAVTVLMLVAVLLFVGYPFLRPRAHVADELDLPATGQREQLLAERENALAVLKDLELEHDIGNISREDYDALRLAQRHRAVAIMRELDEVATPVSDATPAFHNVLDNLALDDRIEAEISQARRRLDDTRETDDGPPSHDGRWECYMYASVDSADSRGFRRLRWGRVDPGGIGVAQVISPIVDVARTEHGPARCATAPARSIRMSGTA